MFDGIKFAGGRLANAQETRKVLFIITDGEPTCNSFHGSTIDMGLACRKILTQLHKVGVETVCLGYGSRLSIGACFPVYATIHDNASGRGMDLPSFFIELKKVLMDDSKRALRETT